MNRESIKFISFTTNSSLVQTQLFVSDNAVVFLLSYCYKDKSLYYQVLLFAPAGAPIIHCSIASFSRKAHAHDDVLSR